MSRHSLLGAARLWCSGPTVLVGPWFPNNWRTTSWAVRDGRRHLRRHRCLRHRRLFLVSQVKTRIFFERPTSSAARLLLWAGGSPTTPAPSPTTTTTRNCRRSLSGAPLRHQNFLGTSLQLYIDCSLPEVHHSSLLNGKGDVSTSSLSLCQ